MFTPGSPDGTKAGCTCPSELNEEGTGATMAKDSQMTYFVVAEDCPLHGKAIWREKAVT